MYHSAAFIPRIIGAQLGYLSVSSTRDGVGVNGLPISKNVELLKKIKNSALRDFLLKQHAIPNPTCRQDHGVRRQHCAVLLQDSATKRYDPPSKP
jgi:hypothetical protein